MYCPLVGCITTWFLIYLHFNRVPPFHDDFLISVEFYINSYVEIFLVNEIASGGVKLVALSKYIPCVLRNCAAKFYISCIGTLTAKIP